MNKTKTTSENSPLNINSQRALANHNSAAVGQQKNIHTNHTHHNKQHACPSAGRKTLQKNTKKYQITVSRLSHQFSILPHQQTPKNSIKHQKTIQFDTI